MNQRGGSLGARLGLIDPLPNVYTSRPDLCVGAVFSWGKAPPQAYIGQMLFERSEAELIRYARGGDGSAIAQLLRPEYSAAFHVAFGLLHDVNEAEDASS
jgi:hypothetical protein